MEAPDKIYVNFPFGEKHPWRGPMVTEQGLNRYDTTYIRKDALIEWAEDFKAKTGWYEIEVAMDDLIDKLNSM